LNIVCTLNQTIASGGVEKNCAEPGSKWSCRQSDECSSRRWWRRLQLKSRRLFTSKIASGGNLWTGGSRWRRRDLRKTVDRQHGAHLCEMTIACVLIHPSACVHCLWVEPALLL